MNGNKPRNFQIRSALILPVFLALLFLGAMVWAKSDDLFARKWFKVRTPSHGQVQCVAVLPKPIRACPVVVYLHRSGSNLMTDGRELRQLAELGLATVSLEYNQTNWTAFEEQFSAVLDYVRCQSWALSNSVAWVGDSLGAQNALSFLEKHPDTRPRLFVQLAAGQNQKSAVTNPQTLRQRTRSFIVDMPFEPDRPLVIRQVGELVKSYMTPNHPQPEFATPKTIPFFLCALPAFLWLGIFAASRPNNCKKEKFCFTKVEISLRVFAGVLVPWALAETAVHLIPQRCEVNKWSLQLARSKLLAPKWHDDFEFLAEQPIWKGQILKTLLTHVELAHYTVFELINWKVPPDIYRDFVLSPVIEGSEREMNWRRPLWEFYYPRIRKQNTTETAAQIVVRTLRERITVWPEFDAQQGIETIWRDKLTGTNGFELIYVATLRSAGVPARLNSTRTAEFWDGETWKLAPRAISYGMPELVQLGSDK